MDRQRLGLAFVASLACAAFACGSSSSSEAIGDAGSSGDAGAVVTMADGGLPASGGEGGGIGVDGSPGGNEGDGPSAGGDALSMGGDAGDGTSAGEDAGDASSSGEDASDAAGAKVDAAGADAGDATTTKGDGGGGDASHPVDASSTGMDAGTDGSCVVAAGSIIGTLTDPDTVTPVAPPNPPGITFNDTDGNLVNAHGGGIIKVCDTFYLHGEYFLSTTTDNNFNGFSMYSSKDMVTWKNEGIILPQQATGSLLGPMRKGERPHIIQCPSTGEYVLYAHAADVTYQADKEVVYATSSTVNGVYSFKGALENASGAMAAHSDMSALTDGNNAYVVTESGWVYTLASDCHSWLSAKQYPTVNGTTSGSEAPTVFKANGTFYWFGSDKTGWRANDDFYSTAPAMTGPWTYQGYIAPVGTAGTAADKLTWMTQTTWVMPIVGSAGTVYMFWGDHWYGDQSTAAPGQHNYLTTYVFQPLVFSTSTVTLLPTYQVSWKLDVGAGTWTP